MYASSSSSSGTTLPLFTESGTVAEEEGSPRGSVPGALPAGWSGGDVRAIGMRGPAGVRQRRRLVEMLDDCGSMHRRHVRVRSRALEQAAAQAQWVALELAALDDMPEVQRLIAARSRPPHPLPWHSSQAPPPSAAIISNSTCPVLLALWQRAQAAGRRGVGGGVHSEDEGTRSYGVFLEEAQAEMRAARVQLQVRAAVLYSQLASAAAALCHEALERSFNATSALSLSIQVAWPRFPC